MPSFAAFGGRPAGSRPAGVSALERQPNRDANPPGYGISSLSRIFGAPPSSSGPSRRIGEPPSSSSIYNMMQRFDRMVNDDQSDKDNNDGEPKDEDISKIIEQSINRGARDFFSGANILGSSIKIDDGDA